MTRIDVNAFVGAYPFRDIGEWQAERLVGELDQLQIDVAWVSHLSAIFWRDPTAGNAALYDAAAREPRFRPVPAVHPGLPDWESALDEAVRRGAPAVRADPCRYGLPPAGAEMRGLVAACGARRIPLLLAVRLEDSRQRHPGDGAADLEPWALRTLLRCDAHARLIVTHADRECVEQVHFGSTPGEASRILWDICWIWGPPEDHLATLLQTVGRARFTFGTGVPLRLGESSIAKLDLLGLAPDSRAAVEADNLRRFCAGAAV